MIGQITELVIVLFIVVTAIVRKVDVFDFFREKDGGKKLSIERLGMFVCLWLLVWLVKEIAPKESIDKMYMILVAFIGILSFSPKLLKGIVHKITDGYVEKKK